MSKKVVGIIRLYCGNAGNIQYYNLQEIGLAREYAKHGYLVWIFLLKRDNKKIQLETIDHNINVIFPKTWNVCNHGIFDVRILNELHVKLVHLNGDNQFYVPIVSRYCQNNGIEVYNYVGMIESISNNKIKKIISAIITRRNLIWYKKNLTIAKTIWVKQQMESKGVAGVMLAPVGLDISGIPLIFESKEKMRREIGVPVDKKIFLYIGRMESEKEPFKAIDLLELLDEKYVLLMIGDGRLSSCIDRTIADRKLEKRVYRFSKIKNSDIYKYYRAADYFVNWNKSEIFGMCILEAMYNKCMVVAINSPGPQMILENGKNGFIVENLQEVKNILQNEMIDRETIENNAYKHICDCYLWKHSYKKIEDFRMNKGKYEITY